MLHPIKKPDCYDQMIRLTELAKWTAAFGILHDITCLAAFDDDPNLPIRSDLIKSLNEIQPGFIANYGGEEFLRRTRGAFIQFIDSHTKNPEAGKWLWSKWAAIAIPVIRLIAVSQDRKQHINFLKIFEHDIRLLESFAGDDDLSNYPSSLSIIL